VRRLALVGLAAALGCGAEAPAPDKPTWVDDVKPILQANCFHCHGPTANYDKWGTNRWDVYDLTDPNWAMVGAGEVRDAMMRRIFVSARDKAHFGTIPIYVSPEATDDARMPPPPAVRISERDISVLEKWAATGFTLGSHDPNHKPAIRWLQQGKTLAVTDGDADQVMGKLDCGGTEVLLNRSGNHTLPQGAVAPCSGMLYDGFDLVSVELK
jgi:hypothetical protein